MTDSHHTTDFEKTVLFERHVSLNAKIVEFAGWQMPINYQTGIVGEHLATRKQAGLFDVSHMGRFVLRGSQTVPFLQHVLTNNCASLELGRAQYTMIPNERGGAVDDAYLYRFREDEYLLVVNAANKTKDCRHLESFLSSFRDVEMIDRTKNLAMLALQGPLSKPILEGVLDDGELPEPLRNSLCISRLDGHEILVARTGYTGEPIGFELFVPGEQAEAVWNLLLERGAVPAGLGARDTLRLEAGLPLYGHELGEDPSGEEIPIFACPLARFAVSFNPLKGDFVGRDALSRQFHAYRRIIHRDFSDVQDLPRRIKPLLLIDRGVARAGARVLADGSHAGWVTSGTAVPYWKTAGEGLHSRLTGERSMRSICLALVDSSLISSDRVSVEIRSKHSKAMIVPYHLRSEAPPYARAILHGVAGESEETGIGPADRQAQALHKVDLLLDKSIENTNWRRRECVNLIPSEQSQSPMTRLLSVMDPAFRYGEHRKVKALDDMEVFFYQGTDFIAEVETLLEEELRSFLDCRLLETRVISGQMANTAVFSGLVDFLNRTNTKTERKKIRSVMNNSLLRGGHLSARAMGALRDFVAIDPLTEKSAVVHFPVLKENPYRMDVDRAKELIDRFRPEMLILGKSVIIHKEPVAELRGFLEEISLDAVIMYDMAHVLGLVGPHFQQPFLEGADVVTGSTHKTFFGTQRGIVAADYTEIDRNYRLWLSIQKRSFPGSLSNHHLGTLLGLLMSAYEMNYFKETYQQAVLKNAKVLAGSLADLGLDVAGDPDLSFTETHQVLVQVGYGKGVAAAKELERNNIIVNYQATPHEEGFTASGAIRMGVAEMTRFGMAEREFRRIAELIHEVLVRHNSVAEEVASLRRDYQDLRYCFSSDDFEGKVQKLHRLIY